MYAIFLFLNETTQTDKSHDAYAGPKIVCTVQYRGRGSTNRTEYEI